LGVEAGTSFKYVECDKEGKNSEYSLCKRNKIPGFPTWELYGEYFTGEKVLLAASPPPRGCVIVTNPESNPSLNSLTNPPAYS